MRKTSGPLKPLVRGGDAATPPRRPRERYPRQHNSQIHETLGKKVSQKYIGQITEIYRTEITEIIGQNI